MLLCHSPPPIPLPPSLGTLTATREEEDGFEDVEGNECVICMSAPRNTAAMPCRHMCMCHSCASTLRSQVGGFVGGGGVEWSGMVGVGETMRAPMGGRLRAAVAVEQHERGEGFRAPPPPASPAALLRTRPHTPAAPSTLLQTNKCPICRLNISSLLYIKLRGGAAP